MNQKDTPDKLKKIALEGSFASERIKAIETLGELGEEGIDSLLDVGLKGAHWDEREKAIDSVKKIIKEKKK